MPTELQVIAADNRNKYADFPRQRRLKKTVYKKSWWLVWAYVFYDNAWREVLWDVKLIPHKKVFRPYTERFYELDGRFLTLVEWALLYDVDHQQLINVVSQGFSVADALANLSHTSFQPKKLISLFRPRYSSIR